MSGYPSNFYLLEYFISDSSRIPYGAIEKLFSTIRRTPLKCCSKELDANSRSESIGLKELKISTDQRGQGSSKGYIRGPTLQPSISREIVWSFPWGKVTRVSRMAVAYIAGLITPILQNYDEIARRNGRGISRNGVNESGKGEQRLNNFPLVINTAKIIPNERRKLSFKHSFCKKICVYSNSNLSCIKITELEQTTEFRQDLVERKKHGSAKRACLGKELLKTQKLIPAGQKEMQLDAAAWIKTHTWLPNKRGSRPGKFANGALAPSLPSMQIVF
ncbi:hypothetical protein WN51_03340 [Melipona quadrifasciata]|uniref:Uncharacterized protein n=1 Tax=Melipona quadrifasciata TaxID=166423 RepID=A0A0N0BDT4_9HYME|nr:hypothetical protein WN51_03340 [Melipona quadrifasciata]